MNDIGQKFRWDSITKELQNFKYPVSSGGKGCVTVSVSSILNHQRPMAINI